MHPTVELSNLKPINQSVGQLALACLNALIEKYEFYRFVAMQQWYLEYGLAQVPEDKVIHMPQSPGDFVSLLVSQLSAEHFRQITFHVVIPPNAIFNFIYSYFSQDRFMGARIEGREGANGRGFDNGRLQCTKWRVWHKTGQYQINTEPDPRKREHTVKVLLEPLGTFDLIVDGVHLALEGGVGWDFDPQGKVGFLTEWGLVSITNLEVQAR